MGNILKNRCFLPIQHHLLGNSAAFLIPKQGEKFSLRKVLLQHETLWLSDYDSACLTARSSLETSDAISWKLLSNLFTKPSRKSFIRNSIVLSWVSIEAHLSAARQYKLHGRGWTVKCLHVAVHWKREQWVLLLFSFLHSRHMNIKKITKLVHACTHGRRGSMGREERQKVAVSMKTFQWRQGVRIKPLGKRL